MKIPEAMTADEMLASGLIAVVPHFHDGEEGHFFCMEFRPVAREVLPCTPRATRIAVRFQRPRGIRQQRRRRAGVATRSHAPPDADGDSDPADPPEPALHPAGLAA
jgi:hypothetical protein